MSQDALQLLIAELQREGFTVPLHDADAVALWRMRCAQCLAAIHDPEMRVSQAMNFAMGVALRGVPSELILGSFEEGDQ